jgi:murein DD-endopeptidase MepM/ murein hydrolase activator NlpD
MNKEFFKKIFIAGLLVAVSAPTLVQSATVGQLQDNIDNHTQKIKQLEEEIKKYQTQVEAVGNEAKTLQSAIKELDLNQKKISTEIKKTEVNIQKTELTIEQLGGQIGDIQEKIGANTQAIAKTMASMQIQDDESIIESFLSGKSLSDVLDEYQSITEFQTKIREQSAELDLHKSDLSVKKTNTEAEKAKLQSLRSELGDQNKILNNNKKEKNTLLASTKNKESEYKKILADKQAQKEQFEKELFDYESQLKRAIDPKSFPSAKKGIIAYPLDNVFVTQAFGRTVDAKRLYVSGTHNGVDFRATRGTPVKAVLDGVVEGIGNTDEQRGCYSYGKWVLIKHSNGLTSLYAHLDLIKAVPGSQVSEGEVIGYSGQTGYATGPHLHLTLLASQGVTIQQYSSSKNCKNTKIPIASPNAYLDPMQYF